MLAAKGINDEGSAARLKKFLDICAQHNPMKIGCLYPDPELDGRGYLRG